MCGLAGLMVTGSPDGRELEHAVHRMIDPIVHRGPDDAGIWVDADAAVALGFRRLAIVDLSAQGHQPFTSASGRFTLVFNGEVYNHTSIRAVLEREGWQFRGHSDTEVIAAAFERWGIESAVRRFIGMFAIAAWDSDARCLSLIRDRLGIKPLYFYHHGGTLAFGSELKSLMALPNVDRTLDVDALAAYLRHLYVPAPQSIFQHVRKLLPGHILTVRTAAGSTPIAEPYWRLDDVYEAGIAEPFEGTEAEAVDELTRLLTDAVRLRMQADVPLGALLSGGIDSTTVVALMQANSSRATRTFSVGFTDESHNEAPHAARVAERLGTDHTEMVVSGTDALSVVPHLPELFDEPLADPSQIPTYLVSRLARQQVVVALTGDGGDEVFAGYHRYIQGARLIGRLVQVPKPVRRVAAAVAGAGAPQFWDRAHRTVAPLLPSAHRYRLPGEKIRKLEHLLRADTRAEMYRSLLSAWQYPERLLTTPASANSHAEALLGARPDRPLLDRMMLGDQATYLADDLLAKVDRASMAVSLEARVPLLDHRVVEFGWRLPLHYKVRGGEGKWILRQVLYRLVDRQLVERPKMGFSAPISEWLRGPLRRWAEDLLLDASSGRDALLSTEMIRAEWAEFQSGRKNTALGLWAVLMFQAWRRRWGT